MNFDPVSYGRKRAVQLSGRGLRKIRIVVWLDVSITIIVYDRGDTKDSSFEAVDRERRLCLPLLEHWGVGPQASTETTHSQSVVDEGRKSIFSAENKSSALLFRSCTRAGRTLVTGA